MKGTIRAVIAKIPLAKPLYHVAKRWREDSRVRRELALLRKKQPLIMQGDPECLDGLPLHVHWDITSWRNFRCSYCFDAVGDYKKEFCTLEQAETAIRHLVSANRPSYKVSLLGGEPTTHPHLDTIVWNFMYKGHLRMQCDLPHPQVPFTYQGAEILNEKKAGTKGSYERRIL